MIDIQKIARESGPLISTPFDKWCENFAALIREAERERCARIADEVGNRDSDTHAWDAAAAIRSGE